MSGSQLVLRWEALGIKLKQVLKQDILQKPLQENIVQLAVMPMQATIWEISNVCIERKVKLIIQNFDMYFHILEIYKHKTHMRISE